MRKLLLALALLVLPAAAQAQAPAADSVRHAGISPAGGPLIITQFHPPAEYARWYANMEQCLGLPGDYSAVQWFVVPAPWKASGSAHLTYAFWMEPHRIVVNAEQWRDSTLVQHEAVHDILAVNGLQPDMAHPMPYFDGHCTSEFREGHP